MLDRINRIKLRLYLKKLYNDNIKNYFSVYSSAPDSLNFAYPDFSVEYFILSLEANKEIILSGIIPRNKIKYFSISLYDIEGKIFFSKNDEEINTDYEIKIKSEKLCCLIIRFYKKDKFIKENFMKYLPNIFPERKILNNSDIIKKNIEIEKVLIKNISKQNLSIKKSSMFDKFFLPKLDNYVSLFINLDAKYLAAFASSDIAKVTLKTNKFNKNMRFIGFMASNYLTTETDDSISINEENSKIIIWFCYKKDKKNLFKYGMTKSDKIICWNNKNNNPILIFRQVNTKETELNKINNDKYKYTDKELKIILGDSYPEIKYFGNKLFI